MINYYVLREQEMKLVEYMYRSQIPQLLKIIDMYNRCIELRRTLIGRQHQVFTYLRSVYLDISVDTTSTGRHSKPARAALHGADTWRI